MQRNRLYKWILFLSLAGYVWLLANLNAFTWIPAGCLFHNITGIPCPACGSTRAVMELLAGHIRQAFLINPLGIITSLLAVIVPVWIGVDLLYKKDSFYRFYKKSESFIRKKGVAILLVLLVLANWVWNIVKEL